MGLSAWFFATVALSRSERLWPEKKRSQGVIYLRRETLIESNDLGRRGDVPTNQIATETTDRSEGSDLKDDCPTNDLQPRIANRSSINVSWGEPETVRISGRRAFTLHVKSADHRRAV